MPQQNFVFGLCSKRIQGYVRLSMLALLKLN